MLKLKKVGVISCGIISGVLYTLFGLIFGAFISLASLLGAAAGLGMDALGSIVFGAGAIIILPIFYGVMGLLGGMLVAWLYNLAANWTGGLELEFEQPTADASDQPYATPE